MTVHTSRTTSDLGLTLPPLQSWNSQDQSKSNYGLALHTIQYNQSLRPEDDQSTDEETDRSSQGSADEYFSQTSESSVDSSPPPQYVSQISAIDCQYSKIGGQPQFKTDRACLTRNEEHTSSTSNPSVRQYAHDVPIRTKPVSFAQQYNATGGLQLDTSTVACDVQRSRMRPQERTALDVLPNPRRNRSACSMVTPPRLRRDTDQTDCIVKMIVTFCTNLINSIWCTSKANEANNQQPGPNVLPLQVFITETLRRSKTSYSTLQIALFYLILLKQCLPPSAGRSSQGCRAMQCGRRMFLTALILASKYLQDRNYSARAWSKISGLPLKEINENERRYLNIVCWDLHVPKDTFENWSKIVLNVCRLSTVQDSMDQHYDAFNPPKGSPGSQAFDTTSTSQDSMTALRSWWLSTLKCLSTDIVKCPLQTERYVGSIVAFRQAPYLPRPIIDQTWRPELAEVAFDQQAQSGKTLPRLPSMDTISRHFNQGESDSPAGMTAGKMLANLPTPQQTPHASDMAGMWTPQVFTRGSRCLNSASILGKLDQPRCPAATLSTCPPPPPKSMPKPYLARCRQSQLSRQSVNAHNASLTSSPESVISEASGFSFSARSRSSSISSTTSWTTTTSAASMAGHATDASIKEFRLQQLNQQQQNQPAPSTTCIAPVTGDECYSGLHPSYRQPISAAQPLSPESPDDGQMKANNEGEYLAGRSSAQSIRNTQPCPSIEARSTQQAHPPQQQRISQNDQCKTPKSSRPVLARSSTQVPCIQPTPTLNPFLKRSRSASTDQHSLNGDFPFHANAYAKIKTHASMTGLSSSYNFASMAKETVHTTGLSSANRTPVPTSISQNKRMAMQMSALA